MALISVDVRSTYVVVYNDCNNSVVLGCSWLQTLMPRKKTFFYFLERVVHVLLLCKKCLYFYLGRKNPKVDKIDKNLCEKKKNFWKKEFLTFFFWESILHFFTHLKAAWKNVFYKCDIEFHFAFIPGVGGSIFFF
jgi:hypothetical protein